MTAHQILRRTVLSAFVLAVASVLPASDPPDSKVNPQSGFIETADSYWSGSDYSVRHTIHRGEGQPPIVTALTSSGLDEMGSRLAISGSGDSWVVWWRDDTTDEVLIRKRTYSTGSWDSARRVSDASESSRGPEIVFDGSHPWVVYEATAQGGTEVSVAIIDESPDPISPLGLRVTSFAGDVDPIIQSDSGHLWVSWVDSATNVGWCEYDYQTGTWSSPSYESYTSDSLEAARARIRTDVLEN